MKAIYLSILLLVTTVCFGQYNETIRTGRPGQAIGAFTVGKSILQFQQGIEYNSVANTKYTPMGFVNNNIIRYGISEKFEISALVDYQSDYTKFDSTSFSANGISNLHLGFRVHLSNQNAWMPSTGFQMRLRTLAVSSSYKIKSLAPVMIFVANWNLPRDLSIGTNWILSYNGNNSTPTGKYVLNFGFPVHGKWSGFIENYGQVSLGKFSNYVDGGFGYLLNNNLLLDISAGYGDNQGIQDYFVSTGISWRILNFRKMNDE